MKTFLIGVAIAVTGIIGLIVFTLVIVIKAQRAPKQRGSSMGEDELQS